MIFGDLTTLEDVKRWLSQGGPPRSGQAAMSDVDDDLLQRLVTSASVAIQSWCNRSFAKQDWIEVRDGYGSPFAKFPFAAWPVSAVSLVVAAGITIPPIPFQQPAPPGMAVATFYPSLAGYQFTPTQLYIRGYCVPREPMCLMMQYTAGYDPIPDDLQQATIDMVALWYRERGRIGERSKSLGGGETVAYQGPVFSRRDIIGSDIQSVVEQYQSQAPISGYLQQASTQTSAAIVAGAA